MELKTLKYKFDEVFSLLQNENQGSFLIRQEYNIEGPLNGQLIIELIDKTKVHEDNYGLVGTITYSLLNETEIEGVIVEILESTGAIINKADFDTVYDQEMCIEYLEIFSKYLKIYMHRKI